MNSISRNGAQAAAFMAFSRFVAPLSKKCQVGAYRIRHVDYDMGNANFFACTIYPATCVYYFKRQELYRTACPARARMSGLPIASPPAQRIFFNVGMENVWTG
jgi:hypothetical protein